MSELQTALDKAKTLRRFDSTDIDGWIVEPVIMEAARLVANPNIEAAWHWAIKRTPMSLEFVAGIVAAALTPRDTDGH